MHVLHTLVLYLKSLLFPDFSESDLQSKVLIDGTFPTPQQSQCYQESIRAGRGESELHCLEAAKVGLQGWQLPSLNIVIVNVLHSLFASLSV